MQHEPVMEVFSSLMLLSVILTDFAHDLRAGLEQSPVHATRIMCSYLLSADRRLRRAIPFISFAEDSCV